jgi:gamma-glutamylcyclotransferase (GGCT)/AIG2-like uncharacterized protein YtfP
MTHMAWWQDSDFRVHLDGVLTHVNEANDAAKVSPATRTCELYFHALNKLWNAFGQHEGEPGRADTPSFISLLKTLPEALRPILLESTVLKNLVDLTPEVMDHFVLKSRRYRPGQEIAVPLRRDATEKHRKLRNAHSALIQEKPEATADGVLKKLAEFLFVVRSNIAHGEKAPYGPDVDKARRDEEVSALVVTVQKLIIDLLFDRPSQKLVAYGTLRPGGPNEDMLKELAGDWQPCWVHGTIQERGSLSFFQWQPGRNPIEAMLFTAPSLAEAWERLDRFEGSRYQRHLIPVQANGIWLVANVYEDRRSLGAG